MTLRVYNTLSRNKETFEPLVPGKVGIYLCGPTVYDNPHIGHMVGPVIFDAIKRYLTFKGFAVKWIVNITDVDDKIIKKANETGKSSEDIARTYEKVYHETLAMMGIDTIDLFPRAGDHMKEMIDINRKLIERGYAYATDGNVWFDVSKDDRYGKLSGRTLEEQEGGTRDLTGEGKQDRADFALWKAVKPGEPAWDSPWGKGRPGWHIECSAMSMKYLGETFDIHGGGMDLMFPHHENEMAQSECCTGKTFAKYWMHNGLTRIKTKAASGEWQDEKMSKSIGNVIRVSDFVKDHGADTLRYLIISTHYRRPIEFSDEVVSTSKKALATFGRVFERIERLGGKLTDGAELSFGVASLSGEFKAIVESFISRFIESMDDDFNTAGAIAAIHELASAVNAFVESQQIEKTKDTSLITYATAGAQVLRNMSQLLGLFRVKAQAAQQDDSLANELMQLIIQLRADSRKRKDFATADAIRDGLSKLKIIVEDRADGTGWKRG